MAMSIQQAKSIYVHRFTVEHVPTWARKAAPNGKFYAPQFASDLEWFTATKFPPNNPLGKRITDCYTTGETWPLGRWLDAPFTR